jgi:hypothetical protein
MKSLFKKELIDRNISVKQLMKEVQELEPKNIREYLYFGSGISQWIRLNIKRPKNIKQKPLVKKYKIVKL